MTSRHWIWSCDTTRRMWIWAVGITEDNRPSFSRASSEGGNLKPCLLVFLAFLSEKAPGLKSEATPKGLEWTRRSRVVRARDSGPPGSAREAEGARTKLRSEHRGRRTGLSAEGPFSSWKSQPAAQAGFEFPAQAVRLPQLLELDRRQERKAPCRVPACSAGRRGKGRGGEGKGDWRKAAASD